MRFSEALLSQDQDSVQLLIPTALRATSTCRVLLYAITLACPLAHDVPSSQAGRDHAFFADFLLFRR